MLGQMFQATVCTKSGQLSCLSSPLTIISVVILFNLSMSPFAAGWYGDANVMCYITSCIQLLQYVVHKLSSIVSYMNISYAIMAKDILVDPDGNRFSTFILQCPHLNVFSKIFDCCNYIIIAF